MKFAKFLAGVGVGAVALTACVSGAAHAASSYTVQPNIVTAAAKAAANPAAAPPGANVSGCHSSAHPYPVVLVNGTFSNQEDDWGAMAPTLANAGYCVYSFVMGAPGSQFVQSVGPIAASAQQLATEVATVKRQTGAAKVDLLGHSQGGMLAEYYTKVLGGAPSVHSVVALSPSTHGTTLEGLLSIAKDIPGAQAALGSLCQACVDQEAGSPALAPLDKGAIAQPGVNYTVIETKNEEVVTPVGSSFIQEPGVTNEYVQSSCPLDAVDHVNLPYDRAVIRLTENALDPATAAAPDCWTAFPYPA